MLSYRQYIDEEFLDGITGSEGYAEIFKNPTRGEMQQLFKKSKDDIAGYVSGPNLYVWDRSKCTHKTFEAQKPDLILPGAMPLYLYYDPDDRSVGIRNAQWGNVPDDKMDAVDARILNACMKHPAFKIFTAIGLD